MHKLGDLEVSPWPEGTEGVMDGCPINVIKCLIGPGIQDKWVPVLGLGNKLWQSHGVVAAVVTYLSSCLVTGLPWSSKIAWVPGTQSGKSLTSWGHLE